MQQFTQEDLFRFFRGEFSEEETSRLNRWLESDTKNRETYRKAHKLFDAMLIGQIAGTEACAQRIAAETKKNEAKRRKAGRILRIAAAAAANAAVLAGLFFIGKHEAKEELGEKLANSLTTIEVPAGQRLDITLEDGTKVKMNSGAVLKYPAMFREASREVSLSGEAFFEVRHDSGRPFTVHTFASDIKVLGTRFNVNADEEMMQFTTVLVDGAVKVTSSHDASEYILMKPSDMVSLENGHLMYKGHYSHSDVSWTEGIVVLDGLDFDQLIRKLEKAYGIDIVISGNRTPPMDGITGELRISDGIDHAMKVLQHITSFSYTKDPKTGKIYIR